MRLFRVNKGSYLAPLWTLLLVFGLVAFAARAPLAHILGSSPIGHRSSAVLADKDDSDDIDVTDHPTRILFVAPDGQFFGLLQKLISAPTPSASFRIPLEVHLFLPARLVYTQSTSSAL